MAGSTARAKVAVTAVLAATLVASAVGVTADTVGAVPSVVVKAQVCGAVIATPETLLALTEAV